MTDSPARRVGYSWMDAGRSGRVLPVRVVLRLHQTIGNREVARILAAPRTTALVAQPPAALERATPGGFLAKVQGWFRRSKKTST